MLTGRKIPFTDIGQGARLLTAHVSKNKKIPKVDKAGFDQLLDL